MKCLNNYLLSLQIQIDESKKKIFKTFGMDYYKSKDGFSFGEIYSMAGRDDRVLTLTFKRETESGQKYPEGITCIIIY